MQNLRHHQSLGPVVASILISICVAHILTVSTAAYAETASQREAISDLQNKISQRTSAIQALEKEIAGYVGQLTELGSQASSLSATIKSLQLTQKKLEADIKITQNRIEEKNFQIQQLGNQISDKEDTISDNRRIIARSFAVMNEIGDRSLAELLLAKGSLSSAWDSLENLSTVQNGLSERIVQLQNVKVGLENNKQDTENAKLELQSLNTQLNNQRRVVVSTAAEQNQLLKETKNSQAEYAKLLADRQKQKDAFEKEIDQLEAALKITIDPNSIPRTGSGVLAYPLDKPIRITQYFGGTAFATKNPQIYKSGTHPGIDFGASIGTPVRAAMSGVIVGSGNMDLAGRGRCRAYGKWIMIKHDNGLSTLYAHLSLIGVKNGDIVSTGEVIGYSGNTGATTGPHLHFGVYATEGVRITNLVSSSYCSGVLYPLADPSAYLNPLSYI